ncbi:MAG: LLM class flavin-dependent oxidoreductase [Acidimicrobiia bacterium]|nr:LLM class flavin-dependent oxidoreductase [Acidimicrobiia bacterium]
MKFGLFLQPLHHPSEEPTAALERDLDLVVLLDELGYDQVWVGEHHSSGWENIAAPEAFIAAAAERTERIRFGTGVIQLGIHHPLVALDRMIFLDHLTRGRTSFGFGVGGGIPSDLTVFGLDKETAGRRTAESLDVMLRLLADDGPVTVEADWFEVHDAELQMRPYTEPHMEFAVASTHPANVEMMGRLGGQVLMGGLPDRVSGVLDALEAGAASAGRRATRDQIRFSYVLHLADTTDEAVEGFRDGAKREFLEFQVGYNGRPRPAGSLDDWYDDYVARNIIGSPADAVARIRAIEADSGGIGGIIFMNREWAGVEANRKSWRLFAEEVAPNFQ